MGAMTTRFLNVMLLMVSGVKSRGLVMLVRKLAVKVELAGQQDGWRAVKKEGSGIFRDGDSLTVRQE